MAQLFHYSTNTLARVSIFGALFVVAGSLWLVDALNRSPYVTREREARTQPVPFSHAHHVGDAGIDCRYCHTSVEKSAVAGMPSTKTCMNCHSQLWSQTPALEPVRESFRTDRPLEWTRVHDLPDFAYFNHSAHVNKGIGCNTCHGRVDQMPLMWQQASLQMEWCLDCHRQPAKYVRPQAEVFNPAWQPPANQQEEGEKLVKEYRLRPRTSCSTCHR